MFDYLVAHGRMKEKEARQKFRQVRTNQRAVFETRDTNLPISELYFRHVTQTYQSASCIFDT